MIKGDYPTPWILAKICSEICKHFINLDKRTLAYAATILLADIYAQEKSDTEHLKELL